MACYQLKPDVPLKKPLVASCFHADILGGGFAQVMSLKLLCVCLGNDCEREKAKCGPEIQLLSARFDS